MKWRKFSVTSNPGTGYYSWLNGRVIPYQKPCGNLLLIYRMHSSCSFLTNLHITSNCPITMPSTVKKTMKKMKLWYTRLINKTPDLPMHDLPVEESTNRNHYAYLKEYPRLRNSFSLNDLWKNEETLRKLERRLYWREQYAISSRGRVIEEDQNS